MVIQFLLERFAKAADKDALIWPGGLVTYRELLTAIEEWRNHLDEYDVASGSVAMLRGEFTLQSVAALLTLIERRCVVVPLTRGSSVRMDELMRIGEIERVITIDTSDRPNFTATGEIADHSLYGQLRAAGRPGLVLFSSGSTGDVKGIVHDATMLLKKYAVMRRDYRTLAFLHFDHIGGVDTLLYCLSNGSTIVVSDDRSPDAVCRAVEHHRVEVLPVAPSFLNLMLLSGAHERYDLSSLRIVTYGAEVMPQSLLERCAQVLPGVELVQKYGATEIGTPRSKSKRVDSAWLKLGGEGFQTRIVEGKLQIKAESAMLGYLNAPSPFTEDGWFMTGDVVEQDGEYIRILGRESDLINVGGEKVYPAEVENIIRQMENVADVAVFGEDHIMLGEIVCARIKTRDAEETTHLIRRVQKACRKKLERYKVPVKILLTEEPVHTDRFKTDRKVGKRDDGS